MQQSGEAAHQLAEFHEAIEKLQEQLLAPQNPGADMSSMCPDQPSPAPQRPSWFNSLPPSQQFYLSTPR
jgi:hypothetical protein